MDRETPVTDEGTREEPESEIFGDEEGAEDRGVGDDLDEPDDSALGESEEAAEPESEGPDGPRRRRRRRGRRRAGDRGPRGERRPGPPSRSEADPVEGEPLAEEDDDDLEEDNGDLTGESELGAEDDSEEGDEESPRVYRNVPTWEEAISFLVHKRPEGRTDSGGPREGRRDGGRR
jgi:ribonuclease E